MSSRRLRRCLVCCGSGVRAARRRVSSGVNEAGMTTAEYAIGTLAACGFAALLVAILKGNQVKGLLLGVITKALALG
jgi:hypothetical protein